IVSPREFTARNAPAFNSAKAEAIAFLSGLFADATHIRVTDIEADASKAGLMQANQAISQCRALRDARMVLGLTAIRAGFGPGGGTGVGETRGGGGGERGGARPKDAPRAQPAAWTRGVKSPPIQAALTQLDEARERHL